MKKAYVIGILLTLILMGIRIGVLYDQLTVSWVIKEVLLSLLFAHIYLVIPFVGKFIEDEFFQSWVSQVNKNTNWIFLTLFTIPMIYLYVIAFQVMDVPLYLLSGFPMLIAGSLMTSRGDW